MKSFTKKKKRLVTELLLNEKSWYSVMEMLSSKLMAGVGLEQTLHAVS